MILTLLSLATAADVMPSLFTPSAVPFSEGQRAQVELDLAAMQTQGSLLGSWESENVIAGMRTAVDLSDTFRVTAGVHSWRRVQTGSTRCCLFDPNRSESRPYRHDTTLLTATAGVSAQWLSTPNVHSRVFVRVGTLAQVGAAVSWQSTDDRWGFDAAWGPAISVVNQGPDLEAGKGALPTLVPELGWSWFANEQRSTSVRLGMTSLTPTLSARLGNETAYAEVSAMPWSPGVFETGQGGQVAVGITL